MIRALLLIFEPMATWERIWLARRGLFFHLLDGLKDISPWVGWSIGIVLSIAVLYQGVPRMMEPDPSHAFGLYLIGSLLLLLTSGLARFVTAWYLHGKFIGLESFISNLASRLPQ